MAFTLPLYNRRHQVVAEVLLDDEDAERLKDKKLFLFQVGYAGVKEAGRSVYLHRWLLDPPIGLEVDHINQNKLDCRRGNMRLVTDEQNKQNSNSKNRRVNAAARQSEHRGVSWNGNTWLARYSGTYIGASQEENMAAAMVIAWRRRNKPFSVEV